ncbi:hypothetical protein PUN28_009190 [Cardiocondyla obscurior]|uniref:Uncharacterized protein n=1 Tax=Cardiocondyla obscurior TaxID=286306 RepID=A0AAW2FSK0_9HYME
MPLSHPPTLSASHRRIPRQGGERPRKEERRDCRLVYNVRDRDSNNTQRGCRRVQCVPKVSQPLPKLTLHSENFDIIDKYKIYDYVDTSQCGVSN